MCANSLDASFAEYWSRRMQRKHEKTDVFRAIASFEEAGTLQDGDVVNRPYRSNLAVNTLGSEGSYTRQDITDSGESLTVNVKKEATFYVQDPDKIQSHYKTANLYADDAAVQIGNWIDGDVLGEYDQADSDVDNSDIASGTAGDGFTLSTSNVLSVFTLAARKLSALNISPAGRWGVVSPEFKAKLMEYLGGKESNLGDTTGKNGHIGEYMGFKLYESNNLGWSSRLEFATNPTEADTIVINGVTFNFKATLGAVAGTIHICSDAENTLNQIVAAINAPGTTVTSATDAGFVAVSAANQLLLQGITATDGATYMTLKGEGNSWSAVSETLTAAADIWTAALQTQHNLFGQGKPIDVVIQKFPNFVTKDRTGYLGKDFVTWTMYGLKTFDEGDAQLVDVNIRADGF